MDSLFRVLTVSQITRLIKNHLEARFPAVEVEGEISNFRPSSTGHYYFSLKDRGAMLQAVMFKNRLGSLAFIPADGQLVRVRGRISLYELRGSYQVICESMTRAGKGEILAMLEERKRRLAEEGLFDGERKKPFPLFPKRIGVVTSPTGAALKDILQVTRRRNPGMDIVVIPVVVQGEEAGRKIAAQIEAAGEIPRLDLVIIGRGGGSLEDLLPFSDEEVVRAVANCPLPTLSAVGHEIDTALSDYAADRAAPTPSAAAEMVSPPREELAARVAELQRRLHGEMKGRIDRIRLLLDRFRPRELERLLIPLVQQRVQRGDEARDTLLRGMENLLTRRRHAIALCRRTMEAGAPERVLKRGFALVRDGESGLLITCPDKTGAGRNIQVEMAGGGIRAVVEKIEPKASRGQKA